MCRYTQICRNTVGGYGCVCPRGYRSQGVGLPCLGDYYVCLTKKPLNITPNGSTYHYLTFVFHFQTSTSVCKRRIPAHISAAMFRAASGVCAPLGPCYSAMGAPAQGLREGTPSQTEPESGRDSSHSWCHPSAGQSSPVPMEYLASPGRAVLSGTPTEMASVLVS